jgi:hypothetical protein
MFYDSPSRFLDARLERAGMTASYTDGQDLQDFQDFLFIK